MAEISDTCEFIIKADHVKFTTQTNGDVVLITGVNLNAEQAASMAYLINQPGNLKIEIKKDI